MRTGTENQMTLVLIRHGETHANREHRYLGKTDESLSKEGIAKLKARKNLPGYPDVDIVFCSPMRRCTKTAEILYPQKKRIVIPEWTEMDFGSFEGKNYKELSGVPEYQAWIDSNGTLPFPGGESRETFITRCIDGMQNMLRLFDTVGEAEPCVGDVKAESCAAVGRKAEPCAGDIKTVGIVAHGGTIMALLSSFYGGDYFDYQISNGEGYCCVLNNGFGDTRITDIRRI